MLNHAHGRAIEWRYDDAAVRVVAGEPVPAGAEICNNYGVKSNGELLAGYGFCLADNVADTCALELRCGASCGERGGIVNLGRFEIGRQDGPQGEVVPMALFRALARAFGDICEEEEDSGWVAVEEEGENVGLSSAVTKFIPMLVHIPAVYPQSILLV